MRYSFYFKVILYCSWVKVNLWNILRKIKCIIVIGILKRDKLIGIDLVKKDFIK